jgi:hypothetical protein
VIERPPRWKLFFKQFVHHRHLSTKGKLDAWSMGFSLSSIPLLRAFRQTTAARGS